MLRYMERRKHQSEGDDHLLKPRIQSQNLYIEVQAKKNLDSHKIQESCHLIKQTLQITQTQEKPSMLKQAAVDEERN